MGYEVFTLKLPNRVELQYVEQGEPSGLPLILLHGYADSWRSFELVLPHLTRSVRTIALTQRGHGDASRPSGGYRPRDFAFDLVEFMDLLGLDSAVIAGGSSGGIIACRFAVDHPNRTSGLILLGSPLTLRDKPGVTALWDSTISKLTDPIDPGFVREFAETTLGQSVPNRFLEAMLKENMKVPARVWKATLRGLMEDASSEELNQVKAPTLIVWGEKDAIVGRSEQESLRDRIAGSRLVIYSNAGHALYWEEPARVASDINAFLADVWLGFKA